MASLAANGSNCIVTSSIDKTLKVWDLDNMEEAVHSMDRHDLPMEEVMVAGGRLAGRSRNCVVLWNPDTGRVLRKVSDTVLGAVITLAALTSDGELLVTVECNCLMVWSLATTNGPLVKVPVQEVVQLVLYCEDTRLLVVARESTEGGHVLRVDGHLLPNAELTFNLEFPVTRVKPVCLTQDESWLVGLGWEAERPVIFVFHTDSGEFLHTLPLKMATIKDVVRMVPVRDKHNTIALIEGDKATVCDLKNRRVVKTIPCWTGQATSDGRWGLAAPARGGLHLLDMEQDGTVARTFIPRRAQGVATNHAMFTPSDEYVVYYNSAEKGIDVFRVDGGQRLASYHVQAELRCLTASPDGLSVVFGTTEGSVTRCFSATTSITTSTTTSPGYSLWIPARRSHTGTSGAFPPGRSPLTEAPAGQGSAPFTCVNRFSY